MASPPLVIAHRGASGYLPEHTLAAYWLAIEQGADYIEPDLVSTADGVLVARHENALAVLNLDGSLREATTDVMDHPAFAGRCRTQPIDGVPVTGWFTEDFTLAELKTLRARERLPSLRPANARFDGMFEVPTLAEIVTLLRRANEGRARPVGLYPETKHPSHFRALGLPLEPALLDGLQGLAAPVFLQSFEVGNLQALAGRTAHPRIQLCELGGHPWDDPTPYAEMLSPAGLAHIATYAQGIGVHAEWVLPRRDGRLQPATRLVAEAHAAGLQVHVWTVRAENHFLPLDHRRGDDPAALGDVAGYLQRLQAAGIDGCFADQAFLARRAWPTPDA
jgi:glycerophosphoryl diester phosphodiesterase